MAILVDSETTVLVQGITGREARFLSKESLLYGTRIVAGVTPCKGGSEVSGIPVYNSVREAKASHRIDASVISVPPFSARDAALEAIENEIALLVIITERIPRRDVSEIVISARERETRVIGPNSLGIISPGETRLGGVGGDLNNTLKTFQKGSVGLISRSGGMTTEIANLLTKNGMGQSTCVSVGGDPMIGTGFVELFRLFQEDSRTQAVALFCEPGGSMEEEFAQFYSGVKDAKPVVAFIAGRFVDEMPDTRFGHAAVIVEGDNGSTRKKRKAFRAAGITTLESLSEFPRALKNALGQEHSC